jgi:hypothetical protein
MVRCRGREILVAVRCWIANLLLALFSLMLAVPLIASDSQDSLPSCCRRDGKHHCTTGMSAESAVEQAEFGAVSEKCPYLPLSFATDHSQLSSMLVPTTIFYAELRHHPAVHAQTESKARISFARTRQKRGPPSA